MRMERWERDLLASTTVEDFSKDKFDRFVKVQKKGGLNMVDSRVQTRAQIDKVDHFFILSNYEALQNKFYPKEG